MIKTFKVGDRVRRINDDWGGLRKGDTGTVTNIQQDGAVDVRKDTNGYVEPSSSPQNLELLENKKTIIMSLKEIVSGLFTTEPQKSRQKAGITDEKGKLTTDGESVYINYLLSKEPTTAGFDDVIVKPVVAEMEKNK